MMMIMISFALPLTFFFNRSPHKFDINIPKNNRKILETYLECSTKNRSTDETREKFIKKRKTHSEKNVLQIQNASSIILVTDALSFLE